MIRALLSVVVTTGLIVGIATESRGESPGGLSSAQQTARDEFLEDVKEDLDGVTQACGAAVTLSTDFQNYDPSGDEEQKDEGPKKKGGQSRKARLMRSVQCRTVLEAVAVDCRRSKSPVKSVACVFAGHKPYTGFKDSRDDFTRRNLEFNASTGQLTFHQGIGAAVSSDELARAIAVVTRPETASQLYNGMKCKTDQQCESHLCSSGKCANCYKGPKCHGDNVCYGGTKGVCNPPLRVGSDDNDSAGSPSSSSPPQKGGRAEKPKLGSGAKCRFASDCASGRCKAIGGGKSACT